MSSLKRVAEALGVSNTLVSKVLNDRLGTTGVSQKMKEAILMKAREMNYRPNRNAVALKAGKHGAVGVFLHHLGSPGSEISDLLMRGITRGLENEGCRLWLRYFETDQDFLASCDEDLCREVDGLIVAGVSHESLMTKFLELESAGLPIVSIFGALSNRPRRVVHNVSTDYEMQGYLGATHLMDQGCRRLATFHNSDSRYHGFLRAHQERKVELNPQLVIHIADYNYDSGIFCTKKLLEQNTFFDGLTCQSDAHAIAAVNELTRRGIAIPGEVKVVGMDNSPLAETCIVPVTSVTSGMTECGAKAVETLFKKISKEAVESLLIAPDIVVRQSSGPHRI